MLGWYQLHQPAPSTSYFKGALATVPYYLLRLSSENGLVGQKREDQQMDIGQAQLGCGSRETGPFHSGDPPLSSLY